MRAMFLAGNTMQDISAVAGVTRQRVQQILSKMGLRSSDGGAHLRAVERERAKELSGAIRFRERYGCYREDCGDVPDEAKSQFRTQRQNAWLRGLGFEMNLAEWWAVWKKSGKYDARGRGGYVMARFGDVGPYKTGNVYICTSAQNIKDSYVNLPASQRKRRANRSRPAAKGWSKCGNRFGARLGNKWIGFFDTPEEARQKYLAAWHAIA